jgi:hypothetical protein
MDQKPLVSAKRPEDLYGEFWEYLSRPQRNLILEGNFLLHDVLKHTEYTFQDYSFVVFPFAKAYEGYLKKIFLDAHFISHLDYISDHLRLGKLMSPHLSERLGDRSLYTQLKNHTSQELADTVWDTWRLGRNEIFHYFPHNLRSVSLSQAEDIVSQIITSMEKTYVGLKSILKKDITVES